MKKMKRVLAFVLCIILAMPSVGLFTAFAQYSPEYYYASGTSFVTDLAVSSSEDGSYLWHTSSSITNLKNAGYTVFDKDLNDGAGGRFIRFGYKMGTDISSAIRAIAFYNGANPPSTYEYTINGKSCTFTLLTNSYIDSSSNSNSALDLNYKASGDYIYLYYTTDPNAGPPITGLTVNTSTSTSGYTVAKWMNTNSGSAINTAANLNAGAGGDSIFIHYQSSITTTVDSSALRTAISNANTYLSNSSRYTSGTVSILTSARDSGKVITDVLDQYGCSTYDQNAIDNATTTINNALNNLKTNLYLDAQTNGGSEALRTLTPTIGTASTTSVSLSSYSATKSGWNFLGWNADKDATSGSTGTVTVGFNNTLYAIFSRTLTATFNYRNASNDAVSTPLSVTVYNNAASGSVVAPTSDTVSYGGSSWTLAGWRTDTAAAAPTITGSTLSLASSASAYTYYGVYQATRTITYHANGGTNAPTATAVTQYYGMNGAVTDVTLANSAPTRTGYTFLGWSTSSAATVVNYQPGAVLSNQTSDLTLYAVWSANAYEVGYDNLFYLNDFAVNTSAVSGSSLSVSNGIVNVSTGSNAGITTASTYQIPVTAGQEYVFSYKQYAETILDKNICAYLYFWDADGNPVSLAADDSINYGDVEGMVGKYIIHYGDETQITPSKWANDDCRIYSGLWMDDLASVASDNGFKYTDMVFTAPAGTAYVTVAFGAEVSNMDFSIKDIQIKTSDLIDVQYSAVRQDYTYDTGAFGSVASASREGYDFLGWYDGAAQFTASSSTATYAQNFTVNSKWSLNNDALTADSAVLDFAKGLTFSPLANDTIMLKDGGTYTIAGLGAASASPSASLASGYAATLNGQYGTFTVSGDTVTYTATSFVSDSDAPLDTVYYAVAYTKDGETTYLYNKLTVIPATVLYYEDDNAAISYSAGWTTVTDGTAPTVSETTADKVYGYSDAYAANSSKYSMNAAKVATVSKTNNKPTATFTFAGTGFDLVSLISKDTGTIEVKVYRGTSATGTPVYDWIVDTYYTYKPETDPDTDTNWEPDNGNTAALYQIPVIGRTDLDYGTYTVVVIPTYSSRLDHEKDGEYDFYLDAIRIYNPCGYDNDEANVVYAADHEKLLTPNQSVYDLLADTLSTDSEIDGAVFINTNVTDVTEITDYKSIGPKNEVYLKPGQAIAFNVTANDENAKVRISVHSADGNPASMRFGRESGSYTKSITVSSCTALYYDVPIEWNNGSGLVIIANTSANDSILSVCDVRITTNQTTMASAVSYAMPVSTFALARTMAYTLTDLTEEDDGLFVPGDVTTEEITEAVVSGDSIEVTITTTDDVDRLTVNGQDATCTETADGTKTWTFTYAADETGEQTLELIAYDEYGYASESTTMTVTVESRIEHFFNNLVQFIKAILELIRTIAKAAQF